MKRDIKTLIIKKLVGGGNSEEENECLHEWLNASPRNRVRYRRLTQNEQLAEKYRRYAVIDEDEAWKAFQKRHYIVRPRTRFYRIARYAAMLLLPLVAMAGVWMLWQENKASEARKEIVAVVQKSEQHGKSKATLITPEGTEIPLKKNSFQTTSSFAPVRQAEPLAPVYKAEPAKEKTEKIPVQNLKTYTDSEFWITLEDGTHVHLNYNTTLTYPIYFNSRHRTVYLEGEAYFQVAKDSKRPFQVITKQGIIRQYGTSFNVNTFAPNRTKVVLVEGSISVTPHNGAEQKIAPNELAEFRTGSTETMVSQVDVEPYIAWNSGRFVFENYPLEELMKVISNWYNMQVDFRSESCKLSRFTGDVDRYSSVHIMLKAIRQATGLEITTEEDRIIIRDR